MERDPVQRKRSNRLREFHAVRSGDADLTGTADIEVVKGPHPRIAVLAGVRDMDKRSMLARIVKRHPSVNRSSPASDQAGTFCICFTGKPRTAQSEYTDLVEKKIPANSKEIAIARSYGDAPKSRIQRPPREMQKVLMRQGRAGCAVNRARGTDFSNPKRPTSSASAQSFMPRTLIPARRRNSPCSARGISMQKRHHQLPPRRSARRCSAKVGDEVEGRSGRCETSPSHPEDREAYIPPPCRCSGGAAA